MMAAPTVPFTAGFEDVPGGVTFSHVPGAGRLSHVPTVWDDLPPEQPPSRQLPRRTRVGGSGWRITRLHRDHDERASARGTGGRRPGLVLVFDHEERAADRAGQLRLLLRELETGGESRRAMHAGLKVAHTAAVSIGSLDGSKTTPEASLRRSERLRRSRELPGHDRRRAVPARIEADPELSDGPPGCIPDCTPPEPICVPKPATCTGRLNCSCVPFGFARSAYAGGRKAASPSAPISSATIEGQLRCRER